MDQFKKGNWNVADPLDLDLASDLIDSKIAKNVADDIRREMGFAALKPHKPLLLLDYFLNFHGVFLGFWGFGVLGFCGIVKCFSNFNYHIYKN